MAVYRAALAERTRDRRRSDWAMSTGNQGVALMVLAERLGDLSKARAAVEQIEAALATTREGGHAPLAAHYEAQLPRARALLDRLAGGSPGAGAPPHPGPLPPQAGGEGAVARDFAPLPGSGRRGSGRAGLPSPPQGGGEGGDPSRTRWGG